MYTEKAVKKIVHDVRAKKISANKALSKLKNLPYESFSFAKIDHHRHFRKGYPEVVYAPGKTTSQITKILQVIKKSGQTAIVTRLDENRASRIKKNFPDLHFSPDARIAYFLKKNKKKKIGTVGVITAGTSDIPVGEEAAVTLELVGHRALRLYDCGVAGLQRLFDNLPALRRCSVVICIAGMEGALASVLAGLIDKPIIAVPTSVGYGASFKGIAPLLTMLNSCSQGIGVVNIDNGFGAACLASSILKVKK